LAAEIAGKDITERVAYFGEVEADLIFTPDNDFKFHSGLPLVNETSLVKLDR
jgi:tRNA-(ms[2]io[6]A)-hydroxylase